MDIKTNERMKFWQSMPKPDMHFHIFGAARPATVIELAEKNGSNLQDDTVSLLMGERIFNKDFSDFIKTYRSVRDCFVIPEDFERLVWETLEDAAPDNVCYLDIRVNWQYRDGQNLNTHMMQALDSGRRQAEKEFGIKSRFFIDFPGWEDRSYAAGCVDFAIANSDLGIAGIDMVSQHDPIHVEDILPLKKAHDAGLYIICHAGEVKGPKEVWEVLRHFPINRIAHGLAIAQDKDLLKHLSGSSISVEVCPVSNLCTRRIERIEDHPVRSFAKYGVPIVIASDDPTLFHTSLSEQYAVLESKAGLPLDYLIQACRLGFESACIDSEEKQDLIREFEDWCTLNL